MKLTRVYRFSASHRLHSDELSAEQNRDLYGKCNNPYGHGHDYAIHIAVRGVADAASGRVISPGALDRYVEQQVVRVYDHKDINRDVREFQGVPTTENLVRDMERRLRSQWPFPNVELDSIKIQETPRNIFELRVG